MRIQMSRKYYTFSVPVSGYENATVVASSEEEAIEKYLDGEYFDTPSLDDIEVDIGFGKDLEEYLKDAYVVLKSIDGGGGE